MATGEPSGVWCLDIDNLDHLAELEEQHGKLPHTWQVQTGSGKLHYYFKLDDRSRKLKNSVKFSGSLDIRTTGGLVIVPPSKHISGGVYSWIIAPDTCEAAIAPDWLIELALKPKEKPKDASPKAAKVTAKVSHLLRGQMTDSKATGQQPSVNSTFTIKAALTLSDRCKAYCLNYPPAISGQGGSNATFALFARLVELFGELSNADILECISDWNSRCEPSWSQAELLHKISDARGKVSARVSQKVEQEKEEEVATLPASAYYGILGDFVKAVAPETEADTGGIMLTLLACIGNAIGNKPFVSVCAGKHGTNLFVALVGPTAAAKGMSFDIAKKLVSDADPDFRKSIATGLSSGEGLIDRVQDPLELEDFQVSPVQKLLCLETEFSRPITAMRREGNTLSAILRSAWDCQTLEVMTRAKSKLRASNAFISIVSHITQEELEIILNGKVELANGFSNRFLWCNVRNARLLPNGGKAMEIIKAYIEPIKQRLQYAQTVGELHRSDAANRRWEKMYPNLRNSKGGAYGKAVERGAPQVLRLSLIFALMDGGERIEVEHLEAALGVWNYCDTSARLIFTSKEQLKEHQSLEEKIRSLVESRPGITRTELRNGISHHLKTAEFEEAINRLLSKNRIVCVAVYDKRTADTFYNGIDGAGNLGIRELIPKFPHTTSATNLSPTMSIADLMLWRATNKMEFCWSDEKNLFWVTSNGSWCENKSKVTPAVAQAIREQQEFCKMVATGLSDEEFMKELSDM